MSFKFWSLLPGLLFLSQVMELASVWENIKFSLSPHVGSSQKTPQTLPNQWDMAECSINPGANWTSWQFCLRNQDVLSIID